MDRILMVSSDSHITPPPAAVGEYLEAEFQPWYATYLDENAQWLDRLRFLKFPPEVLEIIDEEQAIRTGGDLGWDVERRLFEMDREGVAGELLFASTHAAATPFFGIANRVYPPELRLAGIRAYHRWVADFMDQAQGRLFAVAGPGPCLDMGQTVADLRWVAEHGFRSVSLPGVVKDPQLPPLNAPSYEPFWEACVEHDLVLSVHASHGRPQGEFMEFIDRVTAALGEDASPDTVQHALGSGEYAESPFRPDMVPQQVLWELMIGRVFDRHPTLRIVFTEVRADWVPATMRLLDERFERGSTPLTRRPSEYWQTNCMAGASSIKRSEVRLRHEIGVDHLMFGRDYPHAEGTWPNTWDWLRDAFAAVPEDEARLMLGENALRWYALDRDFFVEIAERIGPRPADILGGGHDVSSELVAHFALRAGYDRSREEVDAEELTTHTSSARIATGD